MLQTAPAALPQDDTRRARILEGATSVFLAYGFQRTTMEDIARAAEISRPALYLQFRNKTDIYRALAADFLQKFLVNARETLAADGPLVERLENGMQCSLDLMLDVEQSPHGAEMLDMRNSLAADIVSEGRTRMRDLFETAIAGEARRRGVSGHAADPRLLADLVLDAVDGMRMRNPPASQQRESVKNYVALILRDFA